MTALLISLLADGDSWNAHDGWGMSVMMAGMILFWALVILGFVWLARDGFSHRSQRARPSELPPGEADPKAKRLR